MTNHWVDIKNANVVMVMGGNPAEAHPCGFKWVTEAKAHNKAKLIVVDPRFTRTAAVADIFAQIRPGTDIAMLGGVIRYLLEKEAIQKEYVVAYTNASFIVKDGFHFEDGLFSGYDEAGRKYDRSTWTYEMGPDGFAKVDPTLQDPRCVYQLMKKHYERYTPKMVADVTGIPEDVFRKICETIATTAPPNRTMTHLYALGWTQHSVGAQNIRCMAMIQLLLGNMGMAGGGVNALRGHSNIQGLTDLGLLSDALPGYLTLPRDNEPEYQAYVDKRTPKPLRPGQMNYLSNYPKFHVSLMKAWYGKAATKENGWAYDYLPKLDKLYDVLAVFDLMHQGKFNGYVCQGFNILASAPHKEKNVEALSKLKFLVTIDPLVTETSNFWQNHGELNKVDPAQIQTEVFRLPSSCFAEEDGSLVNSGRTLVWHFKAADPPGEGKQDPDIMAELFTRIRALYQKEGGAFPDPIANLTWEYKIATKPSPDELAREYNGKALADVPDAKPEEQVNPFIMNPEGVGRLFGTDKMADGPFPEHYEPFEAPTPNAFHPKVGPNPAARIYAKDRENLGKADEFPYAATTYRLTEHFHFWTKHVRALAVVQPEPFIELGEELARQKGIRNGDAVVVRSKRGKIVAKAVVTKRIKPLQVNGKEVHTVGIPLHWGFNGLTKPGYLTNTLTPFVGDANVQTPEFKAFLVNVEKAPAGVA